MIGRKRELVLRFFGEQATQHGPFGLLALTPEHCTQVHIETALQMRLDDLRRHPDGESREADEVRLMLHEAAQHLSDPIIRNALLEQRGLGSQPAARDQSAPTTSTHGTGRQTTQQDHAGALERYDHARAQRRERLAVLAIGGAGVLLILVFLTALMLVWPQGGVPNTPAGTTATGPGGGSAGSNAVGELADNSAGSIASGAGLSGTGSPGDQSAAGGLAAGAAESSTGDTPFGSRDAAPVYQDVARSELIEPSLLLKRLRDAARMRSANPQEAAEAFRSGIESFLDWWPTLEEGVVRASVESIVQYAHAEPSAQGDGSLTLDPFARGVGSLVSRTAQPDRPLGANELTRAVGAAGVLARLSRERDLPDHLRRVVAQVVNDLVEAARTVPPSSASASADGTFEGGVRQALATVPLLLVAPSDARSTPDAAKQARAVAERWLDCVKSITRTMPASPGSSKGGGGEGGGGPAPSATAATTASPGEQLAEEMIVNAIESLLIRANEPQADLRVYDVLQVLVTACAWRDAGAGRSRLLAWFRDARVSTGDLRLITSTLASSSSAAGVDATMALGLNASEHDRARLRLKYAQAWGFASVGEGSTLTQRWLDQSDRVLNDEPARASPGWWLWQSVRLARLNYAARALWLGDTDAAQLALEDGDPPRPDELSTAVPFGPSISPAGSSAPAGGQISRGPRPPPADDNSWAARFLAAERNIPVRLERLAELDHASRPLQTADAQVLAESAVFGVPIQVQVAAQSHVGRDPNDTEVLAAMLELMPRAPKNRLLSETIEKLSLRQLPPVTDPDWELAARRVLVERLLALLAAESPEAWQEHLAHQLAQTYLVSMNEEVSGDAPADDALRGAQLLLEFWRQEAERTPFAQGWGITLPQLDSRAQGRRHLAQGPVQRFAAEQASAAEAMAFVLAAERSGRASAVQTAMDELAASRRTASHVFEQILGTERAMAAMWRMRLTERKEAVQ